MVQPLDGYPPVRHAREPRRRSDERPNSDISPALDAEMVRVSAYAGLRMGELLALRWRDVKFSDDKLVISRSMSAGVEQDTTKTGRQREVPLVRRAAEALARIGQRENFTESDALVFASILGHHIDGSALRRRYRRAQAAAGVPLLRWHDLRHTYGSLLARDGVDLVRIKAAMGHTAITTTERYLHARPASVEADRFSRAFGDGEPAPVGDPVEVS